MTVFMRRKLGHLDLNADGAAGGTEQPAAAGKQVGGACAWQRSCLVSARLYIPAALLPLLAIKLPACLKHSVFLAC